MELKETILYTNLVRKSADHDLSSLTVGFWENACYFKAKCVFLSSPHSM